MQNSFTSLEVVKELFPFNEFAFLVRGGQTKCDNGLESVKESVGVGELEVKFFQIEFVKVKKVGENSRYPVQYRQHLVSFSDMGQVAGHPHELFLFLNIVLKLLDTIIQ